MLVVTWLISLDVKIGLVLNSLFNEYSLAVVENECFNKTMWSFSI